MNPRWEFLRDGVGYMQLGLIPAMLSDRDPAPAREQFHKHYRHGGGWQPFTGFTLQDNCLHFPGDPPMRALAQTKLRDERIIFFDCSWVAIVQPDGTFEACRMD